MRGLLERFSHVGVGKASIDDGKSSKFSVMGLSKTGGLVTDLTRYAAY